MKTVSTILLGLLIAFSAFGQKDPPAPITKESIQARIQDLENQKKQMEANANALAGAIQDCQYWLEVVKNAEEAKKPKPPEKPKEQKK